MAEPAKVRRANAEDQRAEREAEAPSRQWVAKAFTRLEDVVYVGLGLLLAGVALALLGNSVVAFVQALFAGTLPDRVVDLLDKTLLILILVEVLYTVQVSFREHTLVPEPFLIVGLIAAIRRVLVLTAELPQLLQGEDAVFRRAILELGLLTALILALVASLLMLRRRAPSAVADRA
ncbi:MAG: phosphate-starvation-inducible PsiE family protein [Candidatus Rokuibacteriota bacterium]